jgi:hypothetical protein
VGFEICVFHFMADGGNVWQKRVGIIVCHVVAPGERGRRV